MKRFLLLASLVALVFSACTKDPYPAVPVSVPDDGSEGYGDAVFPGWVRLRLTDNAAMLRVGSFTRGVSESGDPRIDEVASRLGATEIRRVFQDDPRFTERHKRYGLHLWYDIKIDDDIPVSRAESAFGSLPNVAHVQPIYRIYPSDGANYPFPSEMSAEVPSYEGNQRNMPFTDPGLKYQWHYDNDGSITNSVAGADINLFKAWELYGAGHHSVIVAVMDFAIQYDHPDLALNMWVNEGEVNGEPDTDNDGNGIWNDLHGYNGARRSGRLEPGSHGTHVAGTVAAVNNNGIGVAGVAGGTGKGDGARLMSCQIFAPDRSDEMDYPDVYRYAADNGAVISQNSWNYNAATVHSIPEDMSVAFDYFINEAGVDVNGDQNGPMKGGLIVFSAANDYRSSVSLPAGDSRMVSVTSMMPDYRKASYSNFGVGASIMAPGGAGDQDKEFGKEGKVYSTDLDGYSYMSGTSMAAPHISGISAIIVSHYGVGKPGFTPDKLKEILLRSYRNVSAYQNSEAVATGIGVGLVDATMIELSDPQVAPGVPVSVTAEPDGEQKLLLQIKTPADGHGMSVSEYRVSYAVKGTSDSGEWTEISLYNRLDVGAVSKFTIGDLDHETTYVFRVRSVDRFGNVSESAAECEGTTIEHANLSPEILKPMERVELPNAGPDPFRTVINLNSYFTDPDFPNDKLTFSVTVNDPSIASAQVDAEGTLTVTGLKMGDTYIRVTVTDLAGASAAKNMAVTVKRDPSAAIGIELPDKTLPQPFVKAVDLKEYFSGEGLSFTAESADESVAKVSIEGSVMTVTGLRKGETSVRVAATDADGVQSSKEIPVSVKENPQSGDDVDISAGEIRIYPNPAVDVVNVRIGGAGAGAAGIRIYDSAARMVGNISADFDARGVCAGNDVSALAPGSYSMVVEYAGRTYTAGFLKK